MNRQQLHFYGLKFNPFSPEIPVESCYLGPLQESFSWRVEQLARDGGFALLQGEPGTGKSVTLRMLESRLRSCQDLKVGVLTRPQSSTGDFYRELGDIFGVVMPSSNRWAGTKVLRARWLEHIQNSRFRPVLLVDEAQEMRTAVLSELRLLCSDELDSRMLLTVVLGGDQQLQDRLKTPELLPLASRVKVRAALESATNEELGKLLRHLLDQAGSPSLMTAELQSTLCQHAAGNLRVLMHLGESLLQEAARQEREQLDEKLFLELNDPAKLRREELRTEPRPEVKGPKKGGRR